MKKGVWFFLFLILVPSLSAIWEEFQGDDVNSGKVNGTGYFNTRNIINTTDYLNGMNYQPIVGDTNSNGKNEIIIFSGNYLKIFDAELNLIDEKFVGKIQGQHTLFNADQDSFKEIIFISNISSVSYFFVYEYSNSSFKHEFNFTISNGGFGSGISCTDLGSTDICVFMDNARYVHIVNLSSKIDNSYNTSAYNDTQEKIPAIGDLHNNGSKEAVFWFDANVNNQYGLIVFDLINRQLDFAFNDGGIVDDIVKSSGTKFVLKGHPVLVDLNNDGKLEIAISAFYDDVFNTNMVKDWYTELFVYNHSGGKLFSKCEESLSGDCNDASSTISRWEGTNPFVIDTNNDGIDDICFIKDKKLGNFFKNMTINCYNYSGSLLLDSELAGSAITATVADMDNERCYEDYR